MLANPSEAWNQAATFRILEQIGLNFGENRDGIVLRQFMKPPGKNQRFNEYHRVIYHGVAVQVFRGNCRVL